MDSKVKAANRAGRDALQLIDHMMLLTIKLEIPDDHLYRGLDDAKKLLIEARKDLVTALLLEQ